MPRPYPAKGGQTGAHWPRPIFHVERRFGRPRSFLTAGAK